MKRNRKTAIAPVIVMTLCLTASSICSPLTVSAEEVQDYLALGDSISTGYGLSDPGTKGFVAQVAESTGYELTNAAVDGNTSAGIYAQIKDGALDVEIADAELITITCGGNDMMAILYQKIADGYNADYDPGITVEDVTLALADQSEKVSQLRLLPYAKEALIGLSETAEFNAGLAEYTANLTGIIQYIRERNSDTEIIITTQYNPYKAFASSSFFSYVYTNIDAGAVKLNAAITENAETLGYTVSDVYAAFKASSGNLCNASASLSNINLDFHPNAAGHTCIASAVLETALLNVPADPPEIAGYSYSITAKPLLFYYAEDETPLAAEDLIADITRQALDAKGNAIGEQETVTDLSLVGFSELTPALLYEPGSASCSITATITDEYGTQDLTEAVTLRIGLRGDADRNDVVNAKDAAMILEFAAKIGAGEEPTADAAEEMLFFYFLADTGKTGSQPDAEDAASVLIYAAAIGAGNDVTWEDILG